MMATEHLYERIGLSTSFMPCNGESFFEAVDQAYDAGWKTIEIAPTRQLGLTGHPRLRCGVGFEFDEISSSERDRIVDSVTRFPLRTVHSAQADLNLASRNAGIRHESMRQCLQSAEFARDIGAWAVTYHAGVPRAGQGPDDSAFAIHHNVEAGKRLAEYAEKYELRMGFEHAGTWPGPEQMLEILDGIGSPRFGLHFDVGHAWLAPPCDPLAWTGLMSDRLAMVHLHGTFYRPDRGFENHGPLEHDDCTDWAAVLDAFEKHAYAGPMIFEILTPTIVDYLRHANRSREILLNINESRRAVRKDSPAGEDATPTDDTGQELGDLIRRIKLLAFDFDGVFTDNRVHVNQEGVESVSCWRGDGEGFKIIRRLGIDMVIISTEKNPVVAARGRKVGIRCLQGVEDKAAALKGIAEESGLSMDEVAFVGNDTNDLPALREAALPIVVADANPAIVAHARFRTNARGGQGAVREVCDLFTDILEPE
jgi:YrbI family 3-deoxy-D-manno-octulosonate 8-phosphate phosphatase